MKERCRLKTEVSRNTVWESVSVSSLSAVEQYDPATFEMKDKLFFLREKAQSYLMLSESKERCFSEETAGSECYLHAV